MDRMCQHVIIILLSTYLNILCDRRQPRYEMSKYEYDRGCF